MILRLKPAQTREGLLVQRDEIYRTHLARSSGLRKPSWLHKHNLYVLAVWRDRYTTYEPFDYQHRSVVFDITYNVELIAMGRFVEWRGPPISDMQDFFEAADASSQEDYEFADALLESWDHNPALLDFGTLVRFDRLVIRSGSHSREVWRAINSVIDREFMKRGSVLLLKAFPLEYEGALGPGSDPVLRANLHRRQGAMQRRYGRVLGVRSSTKSISEQKDGCGNPCDIAPIQSASNSQMAYRTV